MHGLTIPRDRSGRPPDRFGHQCGRCESLPRLCPPRAEPGVRGVPQSTDPTSAVQLLSRSTVKISPAHDARRLCPEALSRISGARRAPTTLAARPPSPDPQAAETATSVRLLE